MSRAGHSRWRAGLRGFKQGIIGLMMLVLLPWTAAEKLARRLTGHDVWFGVQAQWMSLIPGGWGICWRTAFYHLSLERCPLDVGIEFGALITKSRCQLGRRVYIGARSIVGWAHIGDDTMLADHVQVLSGARHHQVSAAGPRQAEAVRLEHISIGSNTWIGAGAVVMASVGDNCTVGAGSVVTRPVASELTVVGNPARPLPSATPLPFSG